MKIRNFTDVKAILLENRTVGQTIFKNTFWLAVGMGSNKLLKAFLIIYAARILGATDYGKFTFALAFVALFVIFYDFGLSVIVIREFSRERKEEFSSVLSLKILLSLGALILILIGSFFVTPDSAIRKVILILALFSLIESFANVIYAFFLGRQRMEYQAWATTVQTILVTGIGFFILFKFPSIENLSYGYLFSSLLALIFALLLLHFKIFPLRISWSKVIWKKFLIMSWPIALTGLFATLYTYIDSVMMGYWGLMTETGWYNAAYKIITLALIPVGLISGSFYPVLSKFFKESKEKLQGTWNYQTEIMIFMAIPLVVGGITLAPRIINFTYGLNFIPSILAFQILIIMTGIIFISRPLNDVLIASNQQKKIFWTTLLGALINIILNLILIPKFSLYGAAVATVVTSLVVFFLLFKFTSRFTVIKPLNLRFLFSFIIAAIASILMYFTVTQPIIYNLNVFFAVLAGALIYIISIFILRGIMRPIYERV